MSSETETEDRPAPKPLGRRPGVAMGDVNLASPLFIGKLTLEKVAEDCGRSINTMRRWMREGMPVEHVGDLILVDIAAFQAWCAGSPNARRTPGHYLKPRNPRGRNKRGR